jgi:hypothetical protein
VSEWGQVVEAVLAKVVAADPTVTTRRGLVGLSAIPSDAYPHAMGYVLQATSELVAGGYLQETQRLEVTVLFVSKGETQEAVYSRFDAVREALYADRTLGGLVRRLFVSDGLPLEDAASAVMTLRLVATCEKVV